MQNIVKTFQGLNHFTDQKLELDIQKHILNGKNCATKHKHDFYEIAIIESGSSIHETSSGRTVLKAGDVIVLRPSAWHSYMESKKLVVYNCCFSIDFLNRSFNLLEFSPKICSLLFNAPLTAESQGIYTFNLKRKQRESIIDLLQKAEELTSPINVLMMTGIFFMILAELAKEMDDSISKTAKIHWAVNQSLRFISQKPEYNWELAELGALLNVAPQYLVKVFKEATGVSPISFLGRCRAEKAAVLLSSTNFSLSEIAKLSGWDNANYFSRRFKQYFQQTPAEYRRLMNTEKLNLSQ